MGRRERGSGSVYFDADRGAWVGSIDAGRDPATGNRRRRKVSAATADECREKLAGLAEEKRKTKTVAPRDTTVGYIVRDLLAHPPGEWNSPITIQVNTDLCDRIITSVGKMRLVDLTAVDVEDRLLAPMARDGYSAKTISVTRSLLARAIRRAKRARLVHENVAEDAELPRGTVKKSKAMTLAQVRELLGSGLDPWWTAYVSAGVMCGLRPGELGGLSWEDVDFAAGVIRVRHSLDDTGRLAPLKTERSKRTMVLPAATAAALKALHAVQARDRLRLGVHYQDTGLVFARADGTPPRRQGVYRQFRARCGKAGIGGDWHPHELRHTFVSLL